MVETCRRAVEIGLPALAFTEHLDHTVWEVATQALAPDDPLARQAKDGLLHPPDFDAAGYLDAIDECRSRFPALHILTGLELGEPHRHPAQVSAVLACGQFDRLLGSVHTLRCGPEGSRYAEPPGLYQRKDAAEVLKAYLDEVVRLIRTDSRFEVLAHVDYPVRSWPDDGASFDPGDFEAEFREVLRELAASGRALEVSTKVPMHRQIVRWWEQEGGRRITFGSDAHEPRALARGFREAIRMAESYGFRAGTTPYDFWRTG